MNTIVILVCLVTLLNCMSKFQSSSSRQCQTICGFTHPAFSNLESLCTFRNSLIHISHKYLRKRCSPLFLTGSNFNKLLTVTVLLLAGDIETNPGPEVVQNTFPCGLCEVDANWSNGGIAYESCDVWYHRSCADLNMSSFNRLASSSQIWICAKCHSSNFSYYPLHYSPLYLTVSNFFDPFSALDSDYPIFSPDPSTPAFQPKSLQYSLPLLQDLKLKSHFLLPALIHQLFHQLLLQILFFLRLTLQLKTLQMALLSHTRRALSLERRI